MEKRFISADGIIIRAISKEQMIEIDRIAIEETGPNLFQMMENAGRNLALMVIEKIKDAVTPSIIILAGTGGNGGGGICAARHLLNRNYNVKVAVTDTDRMKSVPQKQLEIFINAGGIIVDNLDFEQADIIVDSIIGYNLIDAPRGRSLEFIEWANNESALKISLDIPSGINSTTGENVGTFFNADVTMTLALPKTGLSKNKCGRIYLSDIGISKNVYDKIGLNYTTPFTKNFIVELF